MIDRRAVIVLVLTVLPSAACARKAAATELNIYKSPSCGCCDAWVEHVQKIGLKAVVQHKQGDRRDAYDTLLVLNDGSARIFAKHNRPLR